jgi:cellulose biosynthesis protein BcsQ
MKRGEVIAIAHSKGGAGKTSLTFNLGHALASAGASVLVIDLDTQAGQTTFLGDRRQPDSETDAGAVMMGTCQLADAVVTDVYPNLDVLPADEWSVNLAWQQLPTNEGRARLEALFEHARRNWDVTLVDTPGHQSSGLAVTLAASDGVLIPMPPEAGPVTELPTILNAVAASNADHGRPAVYGIIKTRVWGNSVYRRVAEEQIRAIADARDVPLFKHKVPEDARFGEAHLLGLPVGEHQPRARSAIAYRYIAYELIQLRGWPFDTDRWM